MAWYAREPVPPAVLAGIKVPVMILAGEIDQVSSLARMRHDCYTPGSGH